MGKGKLGKRVPRGGPEGAKLGRTGKARADTRAPQEAEVAGKKPGPHGGPEAPGGQGEEPGR